jgi:hypothetical protein
VVRKGAECSFPSLHRFIMSTGRPVDSMDHVGDLDRPFGEGNGWNARCHLRTPRFASLERSRVAAARGFLEVDGALADRVFSLRPLTRSVVVENWMSWDDASDK